jgi:hypothetical protein
LYLKICILIYFLFLLTRHRERKGFTGHDSAFNRRIQRAKSKLQPKPLRNLQESEDGLRRFPEYA